MTEVKDIYGRKFRTLRISLINTCNLGCVYCTYGNDELKENIKTKSLALSASELAETVNRLHSVLDLETVRFTGGEPLLYKDLPQLVKTIRSKGIQHLKITTNGLLLENIAAELRESGITELNVSLDAIDEDIFYKMSRRSGLYRTINGIDSAIKAGIKVKINSVVMRELNESQIIPLLKFAISRGISIRFLEIMAMGHMHGSADKHFLSQAEILDIIEKEFSFAKSPRIASSTANYWQTDEGYTFGIVANESEPFCSDCNRLRLDCYGNIYGCLSSDNPISIRGLEGAELSDRLHQALAQKQVDKFSGSKLSMMHIGG